MAPVAVSGEAQRASKYADLYAAYERAYERHLLAHARLMEAWNAEQPALEEELKRLTAEKRSLQEHQDRQVRRLVAVAERRLTSRPGARLRWRLAVSREQARLRKLERAVLAKQDEYLRAGSAAYSRARERFDRATAEVCRHERLVLAREATR